MRCTARRACSRSACRHSSRTAVDRARSRGARREGLPRSQDPRHPEHRAACRRRGGVARRGDGDGARRRAARRCFAPAPSTPRLVLGVTILTSLDDADCSASDSAERRSTTRCVWRSWRRSRACAASSPRRTKMAAIREACGTRWRSSFPAFVPRGATPAISAERDARRGDCGGRGLHRRRAAGHRCERSARRGAGDRDRRVARR